jgi:hypothetical protein
MLKPRMMRREPNRPTRTKTRQVSWQQIEALDAFPINNAADYEYEDWMDGGFSQAETPST